MSGTDERHEYYLSRLLLLAPVMFVCHFLEEAPGFVLIVFRGSPLF